jgi:predicted enzyme related to lactoylglutathione lyase
MDNNFIRGRLKIRDPEGVKSFYELVFEWKLRPETINGRSYLMIEPSEGPGGEPKGEVEKNGDDHWIPFVEVENVAATLDRVTEHGGSIVEDRTEFGKYGFYAIFRDPKGSILGIWQKPK